MPEVSQAEVGRRLYHVHRGKTVEHAMKLMQQGIGAEWKSFSEANIALLTHLLQCTWNTIEEKVWDQIPFTNTRADDVRKILSYGEGRSGQEPGTGRGGRDQEDPACSWLNGSLFFKSETITTGFYSPLREFFPVHRIAGNTHVRHQPPLPSPHPGDLQCRTAQQTRTFIPVLFQI